MRNCVETPPDQNQMGKKGLRASAAPTILRLAYWIVTSAAAFFLTPLADRGVGGETAAILTSWTFYLTDLFLRMLNIPLSGMLPVIGFFAIYLAYLTLLALINRVLIRATRTPIPIATLLIHGSGTFLIIRRIDYQGWKPAAVNFAIWSVAAIMVVAYVTLDWQLAKDQGARIHAGSEFDIV